MAESHCPPERYCPPRRLFACGAIGLRPCGAPMLRAGGALLLAACLAQPLASAAAPAVEDAALEARVLRVAEGLRCLVCQNESVAASQAALAVDLRGVIRGQLQAGRSDAEIRAYMAARYGDFVLYQPPFAPRTLLLWLGPFALLGAGFAVLGRHLQRQRGAAGVLDEETA